MFDARIREHMEVVGSDGEHVGRVDRVRGEDIELARLDPAAGLHHHLIPLSWVDTVDRQVHLTLTAGQARSLWRRDGH